MKLLKISLSAVAIIIILSFAVQADNSNRIYGKLTTVDGDVFEGFIRWDKNEGSWSDLLDGTKERSKRKSESKRKKYKDRSRSSVEIFGIKLGSTSSSSWSYNSQSGIRFGHIAMMEIIDDDAVLLKLKSGDEVELSGGATDIGTGIREIVIEDTNEGEIELIWDDLETIEFLPAKGNMSSSFGERLFGTLTTRRGDEFTGYICWDIDELFTKDVLDGESKGRSRKVKFGKISSIERYSSNGATVVLRNGDELLLRGTNDVDDSNSGIIVTDSKLGQVVVQWDEFDIVHFSTPDREVQYRDFDGGRKIKGTVYTEDGDEYSGFIRWDDDEEYTWEILDGENHDVEFDIDFAFIKQIENKSYRSSIVTLVDGRKFRLSGSNDVDEDNKGIYIMTDDGDEVEVEWDEFTKVEFDN